MAVNFFLGFLVEIYINLIKKMALYYFLNNIISLANSFSSF